MLDGTINAGGPVDFDAAVLETDPLLAFAPDEIVSRTTDAARRLLKAHRATLSSFSGSRQLIVCSSDPSEIGHEVPLLNSLCHHVVTVGAPIAAEVVAEHATLAQVIQSSDVVAYAGTPISLASGAIVGTLCVTNCIRHAWTGDDLDILAVLAASIGDALDQRFDLLRSQATAAAAQRDLDRVLAAADAMPGFMFERRKLDATRVTYAVLGSSDAARAQGHELAQHGDRAPLTSVHPEDREVLRAALLRSTAEDTSLDVTVRALPGETEQRWFRWQLAVRRAEDGAVFWAGHCSDVTDLVDARDNAETRSRLGSAEAKHAIRTPLQPIIDSSDVLVGQTRSEIIAAHAKTIRSASASVFAVVDQMLESVKSKVADPADDEAAPAGVAAETIDDATSHTPSQEPAEAERTGGARILLADDLDLNRRLIADMLSYEGYSVDCVADGAAAVEAASERRYDLILMDMIMPGMDGVAATRAIRAMPEPACRVPIVALTAHSFREQLDACLAAGMDGTLTKPLSMATLTSAVESWTRGRNEAA